MKTTTLLLRLVCATVCLGSAVSLSASEMLFSGQNVFLGKKQDETTFRECPSELHPQGRVLPIGGGDKVVGTKLRCDATLPPDAKRVRVVSLGGGRVRVLTGWAGAGVGGGTSMLPSESEVSPAESAPKEVELSDEGLRQLLGEQGIVAVLPEAWLNGL